MASNGESYLNEHCYGSQSILLRAIFCSAALCLDVGALLS